MRYMKCGAQPASASTQTTRSLGWRSNTPENTSMPMMSWQPRMMLRKPLILGPRGLASEVSPLDVRIWNDSGSSSATAASQNGSKAGSS